MIDVFGMKRGIESNGKRKREKCGWSQTEHSFSACLNYGISHGNNIFCFEWW